MRGVLEFIALLALIILLRVKRKRFLATT